MTHEQPMLALLRRLADGQFHSGEELGELLGISRAAVWKHLQKLNLPGLDLQSVKGRGYAIVGGLDLLDAESIQRSMTPESRALMSHLDLHSVIDSTNTEAARQGTAWGSGYVCLAEQQLAGRGRRGRPWVSPFARNIYVSLSWHYEEGAAALEGLSLAVGVALAEALESLSVSGLALKWPNDLLCQGRKLAGILLEMGGDPSGQCQVVVGVGLNVAMPEDVASHIDQPWTDLQSVAPGLFQGAEPLARNRLVAELLSRLLPLLRDYTQHKFERYRAAWESRNALAGKDVHLLLASRSVSGKLLGVDNKGALRLLTDTGEQVFYGGEISLRPKG